MNWNWLTGTKAPEEDNSTPAPVIPAREGVIDPRSDTWAFVAHYAQEQIDALREKNDSNKWDLAATAELRGQIKAWKKLLTLGSPKADKRQFSVED